MHPDLLAPSAEPTECEHTRRKANAPRMIPPCPAVVTHALALLRRDEPDLGQVAGIIADDPLLIASVLELANSRALGKRMLVTSLRPALMRLGTSNSIFAVIAGALYALLRAVAPADVEACWDHARKVAKIAGVVSHRHGRILPGAAYTYALFHGAGIPLLARRLSAYPMSASPKGTGVGIDSPHQWAALLMAHLWCLPQSMQIAMRFQYKPLALRLPALDLPDESRSLIAATHIGGRIIADLDGDHLRVVSEQQFAGAVLHFGLAPLDLDYLHRLAAP